MAWSTEIRILVLRVEVTPLCHCWRESELDETKQNSSSVATDFEFQGFAYLAALPTVMSTDQPA
jgi:hypothetical protein